MRIVGTVHHCVVGDLSLRTCSPPRHRHWECHAGRAIALWAHLTLGRYRLSWQTVTLGRTRRPRPGAETMKCDVRLVHRGRSVRTDLVRNVTQACRVG